jgi:homoserine trans-succinylase
VSTFIPYPDYIISLTGNFSRDKHARIEMKYRVQYFDSDDANRKDILPMAHVKAKENWKA